MINPLFENKTNSGFSYTQTKMPQYGNLPEKVIRTCFGPAEKTNSEN